MTEYAKFRPWLDWLDQSYDETVDHLKSWSAINSGTGNIDGLDRMRDAILDAFAELNATTSVIDLPDGEAVAADGNIAPVCYGKLLHFSKRPQAPVRVLLCIHYDTVFAIDSPFQTPRLIDENTLNGPGVADAKGGILTILNALIALERSPFAGGIGWDVILNPDEETGSIGSAPFLAERARTADFGMLYEPALEDGTLAGARKGSGNFSVRIKGRAAHAGREFHAGRSAMVAASDCVMRLDQLNGKVGEATFNIGKIDGGGPVNVVPDSTVVRFNVRVSNHDERHQAENEIADVIAAINQRDGITAELHGQFGRAPKPMAGRTKALFEWVRELGHDLDMDISWKATGGCCDGNNLAEAGLPNIDTLGVRGGLIHSDQEFVKLDSLIERAKLSALILMKAGSGDLPDALKKTEI
ncbi:MAG: acetylornithine deacetylase [Thalassospira sp.]|uniref:hydrolase n=1 Tax=Thalassospira sp. TaxID=1912094 RepID=UPI000C52D139|nr:hydrolase [Thalassospira sp.]MAZ35045.1 acetylornithine deacetylase [Thalassospira sp.]|tara:strand:+ start:1385 stop:2626 length:1242 start_codon:yes stop_codon:yes gene_type:complete